MIVSIVKRKKVRSRSRIEGKRPASNAANKNGIYYALDQNDLTAGPVWTYQAESKATFSVGLSVYSQNCNNTISTSAWAGGDSPIMVAGVALNSSGKGCIGTMAALAFARYSLRGRSQ